MSLYSPKQRKNIVLGATIVLGLFIAWALRDIFTSFLGALIFYVLFKPLHVYLTDVKNWNRALSALSIILLSFVMVILPMSLLSGMIINKIIMYRENPAEILELMNRLNRFAEVKLNIPHVVETILSSAEAWAMGSFTSALNGAFEVIVKVAIMYFVLYYMLVGYTAFEAAIIKFMPFRHKNSMVFLKELKGITYSNVLGQGVISIVQGGLVGVGFLIFDLRDPLFWGVISIFLSFLPVLGPPLVFVPAGLIAWSHGDTFEGVGIIVWGFVLVTNIDNVMRMFIARRFADSHPLVTIIGVVIGIPYFGILGLVFGPLLLSYFILLVNMYQTRYIQQKMFSVEHIRKMPGMAGNQGVSEASEVNNAIE
jgi:predicted PurR-regulated permease PerM